MRVKNGCKLNRDAFLQASIMGQGPPISMGQQINEELVGNVSGVFVSNLVLP